VAVLYAYIAVIVNVSGGIMMKTFLGLLLGIVFYYLIKFVVILQIKNDLKRCQKINKNL
jgi:hypothetical protein